MPARNLSRLTIPALLAVATFAWGQVVPKGYSIPESTFSPDRRLGVTVPKLESFESLRNPKNSLVELRTGKVLAVIAADPGWDRMNHGGVLPARWSPDGSLLLWEVDGKWSPDAVVLLRLAGGKVTWQTDILKAAQEAILSRTKKAAPAKYAAAKAANAGNGSAYPDGFTVDVEAVDPVSLPMRVRAALTANPKEIPDLPKLESSLEGLVDADGNFAVTSFSLRPGKSRHF